MKYIRKSMSSEIQNYSETVFRGDLDAYGISIKEKDFKEANIYANRIMSNAYLFDQETLGITGFILKEFVEDGLNLQQRKENEIISDYGKKTSRVVGRVISMLDENGISLKELWEIYSENQLSTHKMFMSKIEQNAYVKLNPNFSQQAIKKLMELLQKKTKLLSYIQNNFLGGILNEIGRFSKVYGLTKDDEHFVCLLRMLHRIDNYVHSTSTPRDYTKRSESEIIPFADEILTIYNSRTDSDPKEKEIDSLLWKIIKIWRLYFIEYTDIGTPIYSVRQEKLKSKEEEESELVDEVTKHIENELGGKV